MHRKIISAAAWAVSSCVFLWLFSLAQGKGLSVPPTGSELFGDFTLFSLMLFGGGACYHLLTEIILSPTNAEITYLWKHLTKKLISLMLVLVSVPAVILYVRECLPISVARVISFIYLLFGFIFSIWLGAKVESLFKAIRYNASINRPLTRQLTETSEYKVQEQFMIKFLNIIGFTLLIVSIFVFGLKGMAAEMGIAVAASGVFLAFANLDKFSEFKGAGFEAKLRQAVDEANATIENLKSVAAPLLTTTIDLLAKNGRFEGGSACNKSHELYNKLMSLQTEIDISDNALEKAKTQYLNIHAWDMISDLAADIERSGQEKFTMVLREQVGSHSFDTTPSLDVFLSLLSKVKLEDKESQKLEQIKHYYQNYKL